MNFVSSYEDESNGGIQSDINILSMGYILVIGFVIFGMSKLNNVEHRVGLTLYNI